MTVEQAIQRIRSIGLDKETINICYVMDQNRKLEGVIPIRQLLLNDGSTRIGDIWRPTSSP